MRLACVVVCAREVEGGRGFKCGARNYVGTGNIGSSVSYGSGPGTGWWVGVWHGVWASRNVVGRMGICQEFGEVDAQRDRLRVRLWRPWGHLSIITKRMLLFVCHQSKAAYATNAIHSTAYIYSPYRDDARKLVAADHWSATPAPLNAR